MCIKIKDMPEYIDTRICSNICFCEINSECLADWTPENCGMQKTSYEEHCKIISGWQKG